MFATLKDGPVLAYMLAGVIAVGIVVAVCLGKMIPTELWALQTVVAGGALGITNGTARPAAAAPAPVASIDQAASS